jgi:protein involved in polysaccharide export with SLBB domain
MSGNLSPRLFLSTVLIGLTVASGASADPPQPYLTDPVRDTINPLPLVPIPDDPPPHEGAMIQIPYVIEPPDLVLVEVLEALPGRPISGERLVRPDGTVSLGFYGDVQAAGLTVRQFKEKLIRHLRTHILDEVLGLTEWVGEGEDELAPLPGDPGHPGDKDKEKDKEPGKPEAAAAPRPRASSSLRRDDSTGSRTGPPRIRRTSQATPEAQRPAPLRVPRAEAEPASPPAEAASPASSGANATRLEVPSGTDVKITIELLSKPKAEPAPPPPAEVVASPAEGKMLDVHPVHSNRVFVDVTAYNSKNYYVQGDVARPGSLPCTGNETVLDALNYAGGFIPAADPTNIRLVRPARAGKPTRVYQVDLKAITERGEIEKNLQIFPGDRLVVGRHPVVTTTIELDRVAAPFQTVVNSIVQDSLAARSLVQSTSPPGNTNPASMTPAERDALVKAWVDFWWMVASRPQGAELDEKTFREALMRALSPTAGAGAAEKK